MTIEHVQKALDFYSRHREIIELRVEETFKSFIPSKEDIGNPIVWKSEHWKWFIENYKEKTNESV